MKCIVIGTGVGMAHVCALVRTGNDVIGIIDVDQTRLENAKKRWKNEWLDVFEEVEVNPDCLYSDDISTLSHLNPDLVICATPPSTQIKLYQNIRSIFPDCKILLEKPLKVPVDDLDENTFISCEWIYNSQVVDYLEKNDISSVRMCYPVGPELWKEGFDSYSDMTPHLLSILLYKNVKLSRVKELTNDRDFYEGLIESPGRVLIDIKVGRPPNLPIGTYINGKKFDWQFETFDNMYLSGNLLPAIKFGKYVKEYEGLASSWKTRIS